MKSYDGKQRGGRANPWRVGTRELLYIAIGSVLYGLFGWATSALSIPGPFRSAVRPGVAIPLFFGVAFGPVVGFVVGFAGNLITDLLSGNGFVWNWDVGNGLMGLVAGLATYFVTRLDNGRSIMIAVGFSLLGVVIGMGFASLTDIWMDPRVTGLQEAWEEFYPVTISNAISAIVLVPLISASYETLVVRPDEEDEGTAA
ncbi:MAG TPA: ECF transporter S component [Chloroflexia bacterium]|nr:ECF transporter S component [Chloroflexia bacterium]